MFVHALSSANSVGIRHDHCGLRPFETAASGIGFIRNQNPLLETSSILYHPRGPDARVTLGTILCKISLASALETLRHVPCPT